MEEDMSQLKRILLAVVAVMLLSMPCLAAETVAEKAKKAGFEVVDFNYVKAKIGTGLKQQGFMPIDARPGRIFAKGFLPGAFNIQEMAFDKDYAKFEKLNVPKDTELVLGVGKDCILSFNVAQKLRAKGYTNVKLYVLPAIWMKASYMQIEHKIANRMYKKGVPFIDARPARLYKKGTIANAISIPDTKFKKFMDRLPADKTKPVVAFCQGYSCQKSHNLANMLKDLKYEKVFVYAAGYPDWKKQGSPVQ